MTLLVSILTRLSRLGTRLRSSYYAGLIRKCGGTSPEGLVARKGVHLSIAEGGKISFGKNVILAEDVHIFVGAKASLALGDGVFVGRGSTLIANEALQVGTGTQIAHGVTLIDSDHRFSDTTQTLAEQGGVSKRVTVGQHCWLGAGVIVLKGVSIGDRAVIGAGSVVTSSVPEKSVAMGNPAQVRRAFSP